MNPSAVPLPLLRLWYNLFLRLRLLVGVSVFCAAPRWLSVRLPVFLTLGLLITQGFNVRAAVKLMMAGAVYAVLVGVLRCLVGAGPARIAGMAVVAVVLVVSVIKPVGPYDEVVPAARFVDEPQIFRTRISTFPGSPRWDKIRAAKATPFLFVSSPTEFSGDMAIVVMNGNNLGPLQSLPGALYGSGAWSIPMPWSAIEGRDIIEVELHLKPGPNGGFWLAGAAAIPVSGRMPVQHFKVRDGSWQDVETAMGRPQIMTVELRFADPGLRNIGILY